MALPLYAATLFVSAFLLFLVQPMIGKMILPRLGGTPQVWNTCMVFFQMALLAGYAYTHTVTTKLSLRAQLIVHSLLLAVPLLVLLPNGPFNITGWVPPPGSNPIASTLLLLTAVVGVPFFVVATSAPLLQRWFASTGHPASKDPYFLYGASNLGSMLALLAYPALVEPLFLLQPPNFAQHHGLDSFNLGSQNWLWTAGYILLGVLVVCCAALVWKAPPAVVLPGQLEASAAVEAPPPGPEMSAGEKPVTAPSTQITSSPTAPPPRQTNIRRGSKRGGRVHAPRPPAPHVAAPPPRAVAAAPPRPFEMTMWRRLRWVGLAAVPSSLMLGVTSYISVDISPMPLLWVIPLAFYLLSFIYVFMRWPVVFTEMPHRVILYIQPAALLMMVWLQIRHGSFEPITATLLCLFGFFATALVCHGELARDRPPTSYLTEFYLWMSVGGMVGGMFNGLVAPLLFVGVAEFPLAMIFAGLLRPRMASEGLTETTLGALFPGLVDSINDKGDEIARSRRPQPVGAEAAPMSARDLPPRGWLLSRVLDFVIPFVIFGTFWVLNQWVTLGWLYRFYNDSLGFGNASAVSWGRGTYQLLVFGIPLLLTFLAFARPVRFGLSVAVLLLAGVLTGGSEGKSALYTQDERLAGYVDNRLLNADRSYFGVLRVHETAYLSKEGDRLQWYTYLMHGTTHHGLNFQSPPDLRRRATTYYHRFGPTGIIMSQIDWFPLPRKDYEKIGPGSKFQPFWSDARLPVSVIGSTLSPLPGGLNPALAAMPAVIGTWSEPPYATVGLGTGTMASYGRPFQHVVFYEIDNHIRRYSLPEDGREPYFNYVHDARARGVKLEIIMGDARLSMNREKPEPGSVYPRDMENIGHSRENYYRAIELDAFSSDAIPVHLITEEAIAMYFEKLIKPRELEVEEKDDKGNKVMKTKYFHGGVLMVHTSNRHVDLVKPVTDVARALGEKWAVKAGWPREEWKKFIAWRVGKDHYERKETWPQRATDPDLGRFSSEYVMIARDVRDLPKQSEGAERHGELFWSTPQNPGNRVWTDDYSNLMSVFRGEDWYFRWLVLLIGVSPLFLAGIYILLIPGAGVVIVRGRRD